MSLTADDLNQIASLLAQSEARIIQRMDALQADLHDLMEDTAEKTVALAADLNAIKDHLRQV